MENESKLLAANRGEISVRIFRAAKELSLTTVAVYSEQDRLASHRHAADTAYQIGGSGEFGPVEAYLQGDRIIQIAQEKGVDFIHPGYGFLAENASFAAAVQKAGMKFVGPPAEVIRMMGDKVAARKMAQNCGIPTIPGTIGVVKGLTEVEGFIKRHCYPVVLKASFGGGGRGIRVIREGDSVQDVMESAKSEAAAAFGDGSLFLEKYLGRAKHIEVQILADKIGNCIHLFERDCSVQRKHQKIIEIAPAPTLSADLRQSILNAAVKLASFVHYENAGTVEFLVEKDRFYFIEMNPRIQVEHTVTEEITGVDIVSAQLQIAAGKSLPDLNLGQDLIAQHGYAIQCRVTTELPAQAFRPDTGKLDVCRLPTGPGMRLDFGDCLQGSVVTPFYDPLLVKCIARGPTLEESVRKSLRALWELQIEGVETNINFLIRILRSQAFTTGECWTTFIDESPHLMEPDSTHDIGQKFIRFLADTAVNGSKVTGQMKPPALLETIKIAPLLYHDTGIYIDTEYPCQSGWRSVILEHGPVEFARRVRAQTATLITDTTWRDGQQSLLATRIRTRDLAAIATHTSHVYSEAYSLENWGGATFDVALRFLYEDPWERLRQLRKLVPNVPFQMLLRSTNGVAYSALPDNVIFHFVKTAKDAGMDIFRVFDCLNNLDNLEVGIRAVLAAGGVAEGAIMYTGDMMKKGKYTLEYYMKITDKLVEIGSHVIAIKSMSGVMKPAAGRKLVRAIRTKYPDIPIHMHTHDTNGTGIATMMACIEEGADVVDTAIDSLSGSTSQPAMSAMLATLENTGFDAKFNPDYIEVIDQYWAQLRLMYSGFDADLRSPDPSIYKHEIPGGQYSNLMFQARQNGLGSRWQETLDAYAHANHLLGDIIKATPTSKAVGDLAQFMVDNHLSSDEILQNASTLDFPTSVLDYFEGLMGQPFDGFPEPFRTQALRSQRRKLSCRPGLGLKSIDLEQVRQTIYSQFPNRVPSECDIASYMMYPEVYVDFRKFQNEFGDISNLPTPTFLTVPQTGQEIALGVGDGQELVATMLSTGLLNPLTGIREVLFRLNGELRSISILDDETKPKQDRPKANMHNDTEMGAPMSGKVVRVLVQNDSLISTGNTMLVLTAMKMELNVSSKLSGHVTNLQVKVGDSVEKGDLLLEIKT